MINFFIQRQHKKLRSSFRLETISEAVDHFNKGSNSVIGKLSKELDVGQDEKSRRYQVDLDGAKAQLQVLESRISSVKEEIEYFENRKKELTEIILAHADTKSRQEEKSRVEKDIAFLERNQENLEQQLVKDFTKRAPKFFMLPLYKKIYQVLS